MKEVLAERVSAWIREFSRSGTAVISDNLKRMPGAIGVKPFHRGGTMAGTALTVQTCAGDNRTIHEALELVSPGDVIVVDGGGDESRALIGEIMCAVAVNRKAHGIVVNGAIRDAGSISRSSFPVFARAAIHRGPYKNGPGLIGVPVVIGGMIIRPGDIVVGDEDGVVAFPTSSAEELLHAVRQQEEREARILESIREGVYRGAYSE